jgi:hypothetical protein
MSKVATGHYSLHFTILNHRELPNPSSPATIFQATFPKNANQK